MENTGYSIEQGGWHLILPQEVHSSHQAAHATTQDGDGVLIGPSGHGFPCKQRI